LNQISNMSDKKGVAAAVGLGAATLLAAGNADAAQEVAALAADTRAGLLVLPVGAALGWVLFNILGPAMNQVRSTNEKFWTAPALARTCKHVAS
jgi:photosystem II PsbY protein